MRGSNGDGVEHQGTYLHLCPVCLRKIHWSIGFDIRDRYARLLELYGRYEAASDLFARDCIFLRSRLEALEHLPPAATFISEMAEWRGIGDADGQRPEEEGK